MLNPKEKKITFFRRKLQILKEMIFLGDRSQKQEIHHTEKTSDFVNSGTEREVEGKNRDKNAVEVKRV